MGLAPLGVAVLALELAQHQWRLVDDQQRRRLQRVAIEVRWQATRSLPLQAEIAVAFGYSPVEFLLDSTSARRCADSGQTVRAADEDAALISARRPWALLLGMPRAAAAAAIAS